MSRHGHCGGASAPAPSSLLDPRVHDALSDLYAHVLVLDAEWRKLDARLAHPDGARLRSERAVAERRHAELIGVLAGLRGKIDALRREADPEGRLL